MVLSACAVLTVTVLALLAPAIWSAGQRMIAAIAVDRPQPVWNEDQVPIAIEDQPSLPLAARSENPGQWVSDRDYPLEAIRNDEQGRVGVAIDFDAAGMPTACRVTGSSGSPALDRTTCGLVLKRGRAAPSQQGTSRTLTFRWVLPA